MMDKGKHVSDERTSMEMLMTMKVEVTRTMEADSQTPTIAEPASSQSIASPLNTLTYQTRRN